MNIKPLIIIISIILVVYGIGLYFIIQENNQCDTHVTLTDGETYDCLAVHSFDSGMSRIKLCDGTSVEVPTVRIKTVIKKD
jgi:hypothetical protein